MNNENCNYTYRGYNIVIRNDNGVVRIGKTIFTTINNHPTNDLRSILETFVDALYLHEPHDENDERFPHQNPKNRELIEKLGANIFKGLQLSDKLAEQFTLRIAQLFEHFQNKWQQAVYIRFGTTGHIKDGIAGRPNFQIETKDGLQKSTHTNITSTKGINFTHDFIMAFACRNSHYANTSFLLSVDAGVGFFAGAFAFKRNPVFCAKLTKSVAKSSKSAPVSFKRE